MKTLASLRSLTIFLVLSLSMVTANAADGSRKGRKDKRAASTEQATKAPRKEVAPFVDPTAPLAEFVERERQLRSPLQ